MANAAATLVGQNLGAGKPERAEKSVWKTGFLNMVFLGFISLGFFLLAEPIMRIFTQDLEAIGYGIKCLTTVAFGYIFYGHGMVLIQSFNGAGDSRTPTIINLCIYWGFQVPLAYFLAIWLQLGASGAFWAIAIAESMLTMVAIVVFRRGTWKQVKI